MKKCNKEGGTFRVIRSLEEGECHKEIRHKAACNSYLTFGKSCLLQPDVSLLHPPQMSLDLYITSVLFGLDNLFSVSNTYSSRGCLSSQETVMFWSFSMRFLKSFTFSSRWFKSHQAAGISVCATFSMITRLTSLVQLTGLFKCFADNELWQKQRPLSFCLTATLHDHKKVEFRWQLLAFAFTPS